MNEIIWKTVGTEWRGRLKSQEGITVFLGVQASGGYELAGAFIPDGEEPLKCGTISQMKGAAELSWRRFREASDLDLGNSTLYMKKPRASSHETQTVVSLAYDTEEEAIAVYDILRTLHQNKI